MNTKWTFFYHESYEKSHSAIHTSCLTDTSLGLELVTQMWKPISRDSQTPGNVDLKPVGSRADSPVSVRIIDHQEHLGFLCHGGRGAGRGLHQPRGCLRGLLHGAGDGAEDAAGGWVWGLGRLQVLSLCGRGNRGTGGAVRALQVHHVAIGQVGHETAVWETPPEEIHCCSLVGKLPQQNKADQCCDQCCRMSLCPCGYLLTVQARRLYPLKSCWRYMSKFVSYIFFFSCGKRIKDKYVRCTLWDWDK